jgi:hypothetical protein
MFVERDVSLLFLQEHSTGTYQTVEFISVRGALFPDELMVNVLDEKL